MVTYQDAMDKALDYLKDYDSPVVITLHGRFSEGWFYCYESREYLEMGEFFAQLAGNAPFINDKDNGEIHSFGTAYPLDKYMQDYEQLKKNNAHASPSQATAGLTSNLIPALTAR